MDYASSTSNDSIYVLTSKADCKVKAVKVGELLKSFKIEISFPSMEYVPMGDKNNFVSEREDHNNGVIPCTRQESHQLHINLPRLGRA